MVICLHNEIHLVTKMNTFIIVFHFHGDKRLKVKKQNSFSFWYIYTCLIVHLHRWKSLSFRGECPVCSARSGPAVPTASCSPFLLPVCRWAGPESKRKWRAEQVRRVVWLCTHSWSVHGFDTAALFPQVQDTHLQEDKDKADA